MFISPINLYQQSKQPNFCANKKDYYIRKEMIYGKGKLSDAIKETAAPLVGTVKEVADYAKKRVEESLKPQELIKQKGITYINNNGLKIDIATGQKGFFTITSPYEVPKEYLRDYVAKRLVYNPKEFNSLGAYIDCVNDLKRQDIIMRAVDISTYELNPIITDTQHVGAFVCLSKKVPDNDIYTEIFYINNNAFYYDTVEKTLYKLRANLDANNLNEKNIVTCKFISDKDGNIIGYNKKEWDLYAGAFKETSYCEQTEPSQKLPGIVKKSNDKLYAEAFRFGNAEKDIKMLKGIKPTLEHLENKARVKNINEGKLTFVKFYDDNNNIQRRICYYNPESGRTIVYNEFGQYLNQIEFIKNKNGEITTCYRA